MGSGQAQSKDRNGRETQKSSGAFELRRSGFSFPNSNAPTCTRRCLRRAILIGPRSSISQFLSGHASRASVRLVALPASIISVVPAYRSYQYVVVDDEICIVDPELL